jgi:GntR family transcriptional regulator
MWYNNGVMKVEVAGNLDKRSPIPLYHQLKGLLFDKIDSGEWEPGDCLPSEDQLCEFYQISKTTVRQALNTLAIEGFVQREQGRGTYVAKPKIEQGPVELTSFSEQMQRRGLRTDSRILKLEKTRATRKIVKELEIHEGAYAFMIKRLRLADGEPMGIQTAYLPASLFPGLLDQDLSGSLYSTLQEQYGIILTHADETYCATLLDKYEAELLRVPLSSPLGLLVERRAFSQGKYPIEFVSSIMRADRYKISVRLVQRGFKEGMAITS